MKATALRAIRNAASDFGAEIACVYDETAVLTFDGVTIKINRIQPTATCWFIEVQGGEGVERRDLGHRTSPSAAVKYALEFVERTLQAIADRENALFDAEEEPVAPAPRGRLDDFCCEEEMIDGEDEDEDEDEDDLGSQTALAATIAAAKATVSPEALKAAVLAAGVAVTDAMSAHPVRDEEGGEFDYVAYEDNIDAAYKTYLAAGHDYWSLELRGFIDDIDFEERISTLTVRGCETPLVSGGEDAGYQIVISPTGGVCVEFEFACGRILEDNDDVTDGDGMRWSIDHALGNPVQAIRDAMRRVMDALEDRRSEALEDAKRLVDPISGEDDKMGADALQAAAEDLEKEHRLLAGDGAKVLATAIKGIAERATRRARYQAAREDLAASAA